LDLYYSHKFPMKHLMHLNKLWTIYHFMCIQTTNATCVWRCFVWFWLCCVTFVVATIVCSFFVHVSTLWIIIPQFQYLLVFLVLFCVFGGATYLIFCGIESAFLVLIVVIIFSHNIVASLCCYNVDCIIHVVVILKYDYKPALNIVVIKLFVVGIYKPWTNF
jgi:hypothetical protein